MITTTPIEPTTVVPEDSFPADVPTATTTDALTTTDSGLIIVSGENEICGLIIESPKAGDKITFPITVTGRIDNSRAPHCGWTMFEGQAGLAQLYIDNAGLGWDPIGKLSIITVEDSMSQETRFTTTIDFNNKGVGFKSGTKFHIRLTEDDPSGEARVQIIDLPVELK